MADDIVVRLKATMKKAVGTSARWLIHDLHDGIHEIVRLRAALAIAAGLISTMPQYENEHPQAIYEDLLSDGAKEVGLGRS